MNKQNKTFDLVYFEWEDAFSASGWHSEAEVRANLVEWTMLTRQAGFLISDVGRTFVIAGSYIPANKRIGRTEKFGDLHKIPKTWIRSTQVLKTVKREEV